MKSSRSGTRVKMHLLLVILVLVAVVVASDVTRYDGYKVFQLTPTASQLELLEQFEDVDELDFWSKHRTPGVPVDIVVAPAQLREFLTFLHVEGIEYKVLIDDVQADFDQEKVDRDSTPRVEGTITFDRYHDYDEIQAYLDEMVALYPSVASLEDIGTSTNGQLMRVLKISSGGTNKPIVWIDAGIHAREWSTPAMALFTIYQLLEAPGNQDLYADRDWWILPVVNPDGYAWTFTNERLWRKTRNTVVSTSCPGVDPNRNWDFHWKESGARSQDFCSEAYPGPAAFSEPECRNMRDIILANADRIGIYISLHSYGRQFMYPWLWTNALPAGWKAMHELAVRADAAQQAAGGKPYTILSLSNAGSFIHGTSMDWALGVPRIPLSFTVELPPGGPNSFDPPASEIHNMVVTFWPAVKVLGEAVV